MDAELGEIENMTEEFGNMSYASANVKPRFKTALDLNNFFATRTARFEVDNDDMDRFVDDEEEESVVDEDSSYLNEKGRSYSKTHAKAKRTMPSFNPLSSVSFESFHNPDHPELTLADGTIKKRIIKEGNGVIVPDNCKVYVHYICVAEGMDEPYDSTVLRGSPNCIDLRNSDVIVGLFLAIKSMEVHETSKFLIKYELAFGVVGCPPRIPPSSDVSCIVEVLDITEEDKLNSIPYMTQQERAVFDFQDIYKASKDLRMEGNGFYTANKYWPAIKKYRKATNVLEDYPVICNEDEKERQELLFTIYCNLAQCYLKVNRPQQACVACQLGFRCKDKQDTICYKMFYRFAQAKLMLGSTADAMRLCKQGLVRVPANKAMLHLKELIIKRQKEEDQISRATYSKMANGFRSSSKVVDKKNDLKGGEGKTDDSTPETGGSKSLVNSNEGVGSLDAEIREKESEAEGKKTKPFINSKTTVADKVKEDSPPLEWEQYQEYLEANDGL